MSGLLRLAASAPDADGASSDANAPPKPVLMLIDEAHRMPLETAEWLANALRRHDQPVRVVLAGTGRQAVSERARAFGSVERPLHVPTLGSEGARDYMERLAAGPGLGPQDRRLLRNLDVEGFAERSQGVMRRMRRELLDQVSDGIPPGMPPILRTSPGVEIPAEPEGEADVPKLHTLPAVPGFPFATSPGVRLAEGGHLPGLPALGRGVLAWAYRAEAWWSERNWGDGGDPTWPQATVGMTTMVMLGAVFLLGASFLGSAPDGQPKGSAAAPVITDSAISGPTAPASAAPPVLAPPAERVVGVDESLTVSAGLDPTAVPPAELEAGLAPIEVHVNARPWARIEIDGRDVGLTPLGNFPLAPGAHRFTAHFPDGQVLHRTVDVDEPGQRIAFP